MFYGLMELFSEINARLKKIAGESAANGFLIFAFALSLALSLLALIFERERFLRLAALSRSIKRGKFAPESLEPYRLPRLPAPEGCEPKTDNIMPKASIDAGSADALISDKMAKNLLHTLGGVKVFGKGKKIVNLGELSSVFKDGERVDINRMKAVGLIPYDTFEVKVLGGGTLDKKLFVMANGFSKSAIKMIALKGGEAVKVRSIRAKMPKEMDG